VSKIIITDVFFTALLYELNVEPVEDLNVRGQKTIACTDGINMYYRPDMFDERSLNDRMFILMHEILHGILMHTIRRGYRDPMMWNVAADFIVNGTLHEHGMALPEDALYDSKYSGWNSEKVYDDLIDKYGLPPKPEDGDMPGGTLDGDKSGGCPLPDMDDIMEGAGEKAGLTEDQLEQEIKLRVAKAANIQKQIGTKSAALDRLIGEVAVVRQPWHHLLQRYMNSMTVGEFNWARLNHRRSMSFGGMLCPQLRTESMGKVVVGVDCSGSMSAEELASISSHLRHMMGECKPSSVEVIYFDSEICNEETFHAPYDDIRLKMTGGGGTCFTPVMNRVNELHSDARVLIMFTDLYGSCNAAIGIDSMWVTESDSDMSPPFGEVIRADFNTI
jgi:predicted metal-dependent peptidase